MSDLLIGLAAVLTASAGLIALLFEVLGSSTTELQEKLVREAKKKQKELSPGTAANLAAKTRKKQKLWSLGVVLALALAANLAALFVGDSTASTRCDATCPPSQVSAAEVP